MELCYLDVLDQGYNTGDIQGMTPNIIKHDYADTFMTIVKWLNLDHLRVAAELSMATREEVVGDGLDSISGQASWALSCDDPSPRQLDRPANRVLSTSSPIRQQEICQIL